MAARAAGTAAILAIFIGCLASQSTAQLPPPEGARRLDPEQPVWVNVEKQTVYVDGRVTLREGVLEMFACPTGTKEHESVVAVDAPAFLIHTALLAVGAEPGRPVRYDPKYQPPTGTPIEVGVIWQADGQAKTARAQDWVRNARTGKPMGLPFVFAGSSFWTDPDTGRQHYGAQGGDLICVSNFASAMLDVPAPSTDANAELWFEPFTERIPPVETPVRMTLKPKADAAGPKPAATPAEGAHPDKDLTSALSTLRAVRVGVGATDTARGAWATLAAAPPARMVDILRAMQGASSLAENYLRTAVDAIADRVGDQALPVQELRQFLTDLSQSQRARRTAFELIRRHDPEAADRLLDGLVDDPSLEIRHDAVAKLFATAKESPASDAVPTLWRALRAARTLDQIEKAERELKKLDEQVALADELGVVKHWLVAGPFDNRDGVGFVAAYAPEQALDADARYDGHDEEGPQGPFGWKPFTTSDRLGETQLNDAIGRHKGAVGYLWARVQSGSAQAIEIRYASVCATKLWVNGELLLEDETYHSGSPFDQHVVDAKLVTGENTLLVKVCQNEQTDSWAQTWPLQLRLTAPAGAPLEGLTQSPTADEE